VELNYLKLIPKTSSKFSPRSLSNFSVNSK
jgi:hypothetical protein